MEFREFVESILDIIEKKGIDKNQFLLCDVYDLWEIGNTPEHTVKLLRKIK